MHGIPTHQILFVGGGWGTVTMRTIPSVLMLPLAMVREVLRVCVCLKSFVGICAISSMLLVEEEVDVANFLGCIVGHFFETLFVKSF